MMAASAPEPHEWAKPVQGELWEVFESLDEARLAIAVQLREQDHPDEELELFQTRFDSVRDKLQELLLDALSPETADSGET